jgi:phage N-6-adenine-methyltransferase
MTDGVMQNSGDPEWFTPSHYISVVKRALGQIDLDPASSVHANAIVGAARFYTREDDGLALPWYGRVFCNPPYCRPAVDNFTDRMIKAYSTGEIEAGILLVNSDTSTQRWQKAFEAADSTCLVNHRIAFIPGNDAAHAMLEAKKGNRNAQVFFYFGPEAVLFDKVFADLGVLARPHRSVTDNRTTCVVCGGFFTARHGAKTCSARCRQSAYRRRVTDKRNTGEWFLPAHSNTRTPLTGPAPNKASSQDEQCTPSSEVRQNADSSQGVQTSAGVGDNDSASLPPVVSTPAKYTRRRGLANAGK